MFEIVEVTQETLMVSDFYSLANSLKLLSFSLSTYPKDLEKVLCFLISLSKEIDIHLWYMTGTMPAFH